MKIYDKALWHIDGGENESEVITRFKEIFRFLNERDMLNENGKETLEFAMDDSVSINSSMVNEKGNDFLEKYYDKVLRKGSNNMWENLLESYNEFLL